ncbi:orotidine-5'-phosphate decarboxylase [Microlunatus sp. Y2014]|uniref:orotidine-5'-phosphate decarboxylase n=1 Tax=Microlunatus sp. Y2014 TaxID=3418488 RepID=UPI003DA711A9
MSSYGERLAAVVAERGRLCVGVDPHPAILQAWGLPVNASGLERCALTMVEAVADQVAVVKPQSAFFEAFGSAGIAVLERVLAGVRDRGAISVLDVKRGDIGSTMAAYATAYLSDGSPLAADAITVSPYLGFGSVQPAIDLAMATGRGLYVLVRTSNPEGGQVQLATSGDRSVAQQIVDDAAAVNAAHAVGGAVGPVGVVVGLTHEALDVDLGRLHGSILVPGLGAQGGTPAHVAELFGAQTGLTIPSTSRDVMRAGPDVGSIRAQAVAVAAALNG